mgnify:CR=1 FL=1
MNENDCAPVFQNPDIFIPYDMTNTLFNKRLHALREEHDRLLERENEPLLPGNGIYERYLYPVLTRDHTPLEWRYDLSPERNPYCMERFGINGTFAPIADYTLLSQAVAAAAANGVTLHVGNVLSADNFYDDGSDGPDQWKKMGVLAVEMEAAGLYMNAARAGKRALGLFTISDHIYRAEELTSEQRQNSFVQMITIALDTAVNMANL